MMNQFQTSGHVQWLTDQLGGRQRPPTGPAYAATARFADDPLERQFSVVLRLSSMAATNGQTACQAELGLLNPDLWPAIEPRLRPGCQLLIQEGRQVVAVYAVARLLVPAEAPA
jgi:hypothetical protein